MAIIQSLATSTERATRPVAAVSDVLAKSGSLKNVPASLVTSERDRHDSTANSAVAGQANSGQGKLREVFDDFVGQTFYNQMLSAMRKTVDKPAYFHGGHAEEVFQAQLDQTMAERLADATAEQFTGPMFELFNLSRQ